MAPSSPMATLDSPLFKCCHRLTTLGLSNDRDAYALLDRAATQVKPIMAKRKWTVPHLAEFYPPAPQLLGLNHNHGAKIELRLRSPHDPDTLLPFESVLGTLLHELVHIEVGPHNAAFYALFDVLRDEADTLIAAGNNGERGGGGFEGRGRRVGGMGMSQFIPPHVARERAAAAAARRSHVVGIMRGGVGVRLGGSAQIARVCDPREMALAAAERRRVDEVWCSGVQVDEGGTDGGGEVIDVDAEGSGGEEVEIVEVVPEMVAAGRGSTRSVTTQRPVWRRGGVTVTARAVPVRRNAAAVAAMQRAGQQR